MNQSPTKEVTIEQIPLTELYNTNIQDEWYLLKESIKNCTFIALDLEMTGIGNREKLNHPSIDERYKIIKKTASEYGVFSFGISCFKISRKSDDQVFVENKSYNLNLLCSDHFMVDPESIKFLISNNHDIKLNFSKGIKYYRGNDRNNNHSLPQYPRELFIYISSSKKPIILHNGLIDIIFLYQNFYANAPDNLMKFLADVREIFQSGIYDTKFISEIYGKYNSSHLEYLYYKSLYENSQMKNIKRKDFFSVQFDRNIHLADFRPCENSELNENTICNQYYLHGHCSKLLNQQCYKNHNIKSIFYFYTKKEKIKKKKSIEKFELISKQENENYYESEKRQKNHNAGIDAFMTGYVLIYFVGKVSNFEPINSDVQISNLSNFKGMDLFNFNINLSGKDFPLVIQKSNFHSTSLQHREKKQKFELE